MQPNVQATIAEVSFEEEVWFVLKKIEKGRRFEGDIIEYKILSTPNGTAQGTPISIDEWGVLKMLQRQGAIKIVNPKGEVDVATTRLSQGLNAVIIIASLQILEPEFGQIYKKYEGLSGLTKGRIRGSETWKPLRWDRENHKLLFGEEERAVGTKQWALRLFLNVMSRMKGGQGWSNHELANQYERYCLELIKEYEADKRKIPKWMRAKYTELPKMEMGRKADARVRELRAMFSVPLGAPFPIENRDTIERADWIWYKSPQ